MDEVLSSLFVACRLRLLEATSVLDGVDVLPEVPARLALLASNAGGILSSCCMTSELRFLREEEDEAAALEVDMMGVCSRCQVTGVEPSEET